MVMQQDVSRVIVNIQMLGIKPILSVLKHLGKKEERYKLTGIVKARRYGMTLKAYNDMVETHQGRCSICSMEANLHIDHDHYTKKVRGLLCLQCNTGLGNFRDDVELLRKAIEYLGL